MVTDVRSRLGISDHWLAEFCQKWMITKLELFGSAVRDDFRPDSDIDLLVTFADDAKWSLFDFVDMQQELEAAMGRKVDVVERAGLVNPFRRHRILSEATVVYAA